MVKSMEWGFLLATFSSKCNDEMSSKSGLINRTCMTFEVHSSLIAVYWVVHPQSLRRTERCTPRLGRGLKIFCFYSPSLPMERLNHSGWLGFINSSQTGLGDQGVLLHFQEIGCGTAPLPPACYWPLYTMHDDSLQEGIRFLTSLHLRSRK